MLLSDTKKGPVALLKELISLYVATLRETPAREWESGYPEQIKTIWGQLLSFPPATLSQANESIKKEIEKTNYSTQFHLTKRVAIGLLNILKENKSVTFNQETPAAQWLHEISLGLSVSARGRAAGEREKSVTPAAVTGGGGSAAAVAAPAASLTPFQHAGAPGTGIEMRPL